MTTQVTPHLSVLTPEQIETVHARSLEILAQTGVRVDSPAARRILAGGAGVRWLAEDRACLPAELVEWAIQAAPAIIDVYDRRGALAFRLGDDRPRFGIGVTNLYYQDPLDDAISPFARRHMALAARMSEQLPLYDVVSTGGVIQDYPPETADLYAVLEMAANTIRPLVLLISDEALFPAALDLLAALHTGPGEKPFAIPYFNPITPLIINAGTADKMLLAIERGLPFIYSNYSMAGMSTPITPAGTLALMNAELLAGLTLAQLARPGAPVILGSLPAYFDMRSMQDFYDPYSFLLNAACAEMMAHYRLPHAGTAGSSVAWGADLVAGGLLWMNHLLTALGKIGIAPFVGGVFGSKVFSPAMTVYAHDVIAQALRIAGGFPLTDDALGMTDILGRGPGGSFLDTDLTLTTFRKAYFNSPIFPRLTLEQWQARSCPTSDATLRRYTADLLERAKAPEDHDELIAKGERFITARA